MNKPTLTFIGGGNMANSLIGGLIAKGYPADVITVTDPLEANRQQLASTFGVQTSTDNAAAAASAEVILLAVKPQVMQTVTETIAGALGHRPLIISIESEKCRPG